MEYRQGVLVMKTISGFYQNFIVTKEKVEEWALVLQNYSYESVMANLRRHVETNSFPPTIANLIDQEGHSDKRLAYLPMNEERLKNDAMDAERFLFGISTGNDEKLKMYEPFNPDKFRKGGGDSE